MVIGKSLVIRNTYVQFSERLALSSWYISAFLRKRPAAYLDFTPLSKSLHLSKTYIIYNISLLKNSLQGKWYSRNWDCIYCVSYSYTNCSYMCRGSIELRWRTSIHTLLVEYTSHIYMTHPLTCTYTIHLNGL